MSFRTFALAATTAFALGAAAFGAVAPATAAELTDAQRGEVEGLIKDYVTSNPEFIRDYLLANPEVIRDAIDALQRKQDEADRVAQATTIDNNRELLFSSPRQVVMGNPDGDVTLVEFFDYNCGYCRRAQEDMHRLIEGDPNLRIVLKEFPVLGEGSMQAAQVSVAVRMLAPEKAADFHEALLMQSGAVDTEVALAVAESLGLDRAALETEMRSDEVRATIGESYALAEQLQLTGTPSYVTSGEVAIGAIGFDALKDKIATARESCSAEVC
ncbi:MAG: DsbA family protein [Rhizobiales bacterium]|nr:DsbA family protein [Hyphomicrobiales bacterium]